MKVVGAPGTALGVLAPIGAVTPEGGDDRGSDASASGGGVALVVDKIGVVVDSDTVAFESPFVALGF